MARKCRVKCIYINTGLLIRAVNPGEPNHEKAVRFLRECCSVCRCVYSDVHYKEPWKPSTWVRVRRLLEEIGAVKLTLDLKTVLSRAEELRQEWHASESRMLDIAHMVAARTCGAIAAVDRFIRSRSKLLRLQYVNYYTGCPSG